jgi:hypothetical protein
MTQTTVDKADLRPGAIYVVAGKGPMKFVAILKNSIEMVTLDGLRYWAGPEQITREVDQAYVDAHVEQLKGRGIVQKDFEVTW